MVGEQRGQHRVEMSEAAGEAGGRVGLQPAVGEVGEAVAFRTDDAPAGGAEAGIEAEDDHRGGEGWAFEEEDGSRRGAEDAEGRWLLTRRRDALAQRFAAEVDEQPYRLMGETEIGEQLLGVDWQQAFDRLDFDDQTLVDQEIDLEGGVQPNAVELDINRALPRDAVAHAFEPRCQQRLVDALQ